MLQLSPRMRHWLDQMLHTHDTPERTAAAFALGVLLGFSPLLGLHTVLGLVIAFALSLNRVAVLLGIYSNLPWILPAYYTLTTMAGAAILRVPIKPKLLHDLSAAFREASWADFHHLTHVLAPLAWSYVLGSTLGAIVLAIVAYRVSLAMIVAHRRRLGQL
jgi:uncharacterized protein (DUF2062 family)